jgi:hypothetical protein
MLIAVYSKTDGSTSEEDRKHPTPTLVGAHGWMEMRGEDDRWLQSTLVGCTPSEA